MRGGIETKPERNLGNPGVSFPPEKQKHTVRLPGRFHGKRNIYVGLFCWFLVHSGAPRKQSLKSPCFVSSNFSCFNFFPTYVEMRSQFCREDTTLESEDTHKRTNQQKHSLQGSNHHKSFVVQISCRSMHPWAHETWRWTSRMTILTTT